MNNQLYTETLNNLCEDTKYVKYFEIFKSLNFENTQMVYGKYLV